jgi:hypothetical protein
VPIDNGVETTVDKREWMNEKLTDMRCLPVGMVGRWNFGLRAGRTLRIRSNEACAAERNRKVAWQMAGQSLNAGKKEADDEIRSRRTICPRGLRL